MTDWYSGYAAPAGATPGDQPSPPPQPQPDVPLPEAKPTIPQPQPTEAPTQTYNVPANLMPVFQDAAKRSSVPLSVLLPIAKQESDFKSVGSKSSSAKGIFQFTDGTWASMMKTAAPIYGIPTTASPMDPTANIYMGAEFARQNGEFLKEHLGRPAKPGEYYVAHFMGKQGALDLINADQKNPQADAASLFPKAAAANPTIFYHDGKPRSVAQVYDWLSSIVTGKHNFVADNRPVDFGPKLTAQTLDAPPLPTSQADVMKTEAQMAHREQQATFYDQTAAAFKDTLTGRIVNAAVAPDFAPDPGFQLSQEDLTAARQAGVAEDNLPRLSDAVSKSNLDYIVKQTLAEQQRQQTLADAGWTGTGLTLMANLLDPTSIAVGAATGGLGDAAALAMGAGRVGRIAAQAVAGATGNVAVDEGLHAFGDEQAGKHLLRTASIGALFGTAFGALSRNPAVADEARQITNASRSLKQRLDNSTSLTPQGSTVGAAMNPHVDEPVLNDKEWQALSGHDVPEAAHGKVRWSTVAQLKTSPNPATRLMSILGEDAVGGSKDSKFVVNHISAEAEQQRFYRQWLGDFMRSWKPALKEWGKERGYGVWGRQRHAEDFANEVYDYVHDINPPQGGWSKAVQQVGEKIRSQNADILAHAQNPLKSDGGVGRPVAGFEQVPENPYYMARVHSARKWNETIETYSKKGATAWWRGAIQSAQPDIEDDLLDAMSRGIVKNVYARANHLDEHLNLMLAGKDFDGLAAMLRDEHVPEDRITSFLARVKNKQAKSMDTHAKPRTLIDEKFTLPYPKRHSAGDGEISIKDFVHTDAFSVHTQYLRHMSGRVSLARVRLKNPTTGKMLVNGITSDGDFNTVVDKVKQIANDEQIGAKHGIKQNDKDLENMRWLYDRVLGRPDPAQFHQWATYARLLRKFNFIRVMGQVGWSQVQDFSSAVAQLGLKAVMQNMPSFRRVINMDGESVLRHGLDREIEALGSSVDPMRGMQHLRYEDVAPNLEGRIGKVNNALDMASNALSEASGMDFVNMSLQRMVGKAIAQKFSDLAMNPKAINMQRMMSLGLDEKMLNRVLKQTKHFTKVRGILGSKLNAMNLHNWTDLEARAAFENALMRWSRRIVQENDYGAAHRWMSNPLWQMLFQFRNFTLNAWEKQFLHNVQMRDMPAFHMMWMSMAMAAATYAIRTNVNAIGRSDRANYLSKRLSPGNLALAAFQMAGWSSILPMAWDTAMLLGGQNPWFDFRSSQQPTNVLTGNPTGDLFDTLHFAVQGAYQSATEHRPMSQQEWRYWQRLAPFGNWYPVTPIFNALISGAPPYAPKNKNK